MDETRQKQDGNMTGIEKGDIGPEASMASSNASLSHGCIGDESVKITRYCTIAPGFVSAWDVRDAPLVGALQQHFCCITSI